jgi:hypothetical protein
MPWSTPFDQPILLRGGGKLTTLQHAADYIMALPADVQQQELWQIAVENLINAAETGGGWLMFARIGVMRALNGIEKRAERGLSRRNRPRRHRRRQSPARRNLRRRMTIASGTSNPAAGLRPAPRRIRARDIAGCRL